MKELQTIEKLELKYLNKFYHFLKFAEDEMLNGFQTKFKIKDDWIHQWNPNEEGKGISDFSTGAERIVYALLNGKGIGQPNSAPVGSDLFFEVDDAFIHIDLKTVQTRNIGDFCRNIFVGNNQTSYRGNLIVSGYQKKYDDAALPYYYTVNKTKKVCLTYFITILYEEKELKILNINLICMPNGKLNSIYKDRVLNAGKVHFPASDPKRESHAKTIRFNFREISDFETLDKPYPKRIKVIYFNKEIMTPSQINLLEFFENIYSQQ